MFENAFKNMEDVLRKEAGCTTELDYTEQTSWLLFLKYLDDSQLPNLIDIKYYSIRDAAKEIGTPDNIRELFVGFQKHLYEPVPA